MIVTFDSNVWRKIASPNNFPKDPEYDVNFKLNSLIKQGKMEAYLSETIFTLEAIKRIERKQIFKIYRPNMDVKLQDNTMHDGMINLTFTMGPGKENQPEQNEFLREHLNDAVDVGFKIIHLPRIGGFVNAEVEKYILKFNDSELKKYLDKVFEVAIKIESLGCGFKWLENIRLKYDKKIFDGIRNAPDTETINIANAVAEWADGDTVACAVAIGSNYICTNDIGKSGGDNSIFSNKNIQLLSKDYGFFIIRPKDLANMF